MHVTCRERSAGVWRIRIETGRGPDGKRLFRYETVHGAEDAAKRRRWEIQTAHEEGTFAVPEKITVAGYFGSPRPGELSYWVRQRMALGKIGRTTAENYQTMLDAYFVPALGGMKLQKVTGAEIQALYTNLLLAKPQPGRRRMDVNSVLHLHRVLSVAFRSIRKARLLKVNPMEEVEPPKGRKVKPKALPAARVPAFLETLAGDWKWPIAFVGFASGCRRGELCGLRWGDVDLDASRLYVRGELVEYKDRTLEWKAPKSEAGVRKVSLPPEAVDMLRQLRREALELRLKLRLGRDGFDSAYVFTSDGVEPVRPSVLTKSFSAHCDAHGFPEFTFHGTRHTLLTELLRRVGKAGAKAVSEQGGHSDVLITLRTYQTVFEEDRDELGAMASGLFGSKAK